MLLEEEREKASELEASLQELQTKVAQDQADWKISETRYKDMLE